MHELKPYLNKIEKYFEPIINQYSLKINAAKDHMVLLVGSHCIIEITTGNYYPDLQFVFKESLTSKREITIGKFLKEKKLNNDLLSKDQIEISNNIKDEIDNGLYCFGIVISKYCEELLNGDYFNK